MSNIRTSSIYLFGRGLFRHGIPLVTGGGITALVAVWEHYYQRNVPWGVYAVILVFFFGMAAYRLSNEQVLEINRLKARPYDEERARLAKDTLGQLNLVERDFLRFVLLRPGVTAHIVNAAAILDGGLLSGTIAKLAREGLVNREEDNVRGWVHYSVSQNWTPMFQDFLFPRQENQGPVFRGL
jgi:hypothetical protein